MCNVAEKMHVNANTKQNVGLSVFVFSSVLCLNLLAKLRPFASSQWEGGIHLIRNVIFLEPISGGFWAQFKQPSQISSQMSTYICLIR